MPPKIFLSGRFFTDTAIETAWLKLTGCKHRCFSFANVDKRCVWFTKQSQEALEVCEKKKIEIMMDSGAHSFHKFTEQSKRRNEFASEKQNIDQKALADTMFDWYTDYCLTNKDKWSFYVTLDYKQHQPTIYEMQKRFIAKGLNPVPVYHGDASLDWLKKYRDLGCKLIMIGSSVNFRGHGYKGNRYYLDRVFEFGEQHNIKYHGLAATSLSIMSMYPWYSVDSSTWSKSAIYGCICFPDPEKNIIYNLHVSVRHSKGTIASYNNYTTKQRQMVNKVVKDLGFDLKALRHDKGIMARHDFNGYCYSHLFDGLIQIENRRVKWERLV